MGDIECNYAISPTAIQINCQNKRILYSYELPKIYCWWQGSKGLQFGLVLDFPHIFCGCTGYFFKISAQIFSVTLEQHWRPDSNVRQSEYQSHIHIHGSGNIARLHRAGPSCTRLNLYPSTQSSILAFSIKHARIKCKI